MSIMLAYRFRESEYLSKKRGLMRLTTQQKTMIKQVVLELCSADTNVFLFGSRLDDNKKGGDIDLLIQIEHEVTNPALLAAQIQAKVMRQIGEQKIDVLLMAPNLKHLPIHDVAFQQGVLL
ncbi:MAG: nucleotidyltransferase domain-containing protein [Methylococcales bacterium]|nr:nucleotidyltransferase domain-containing protein [Methylococcales bacterium]